MYDRILVPTDGSSVSIKALHHAIDLAEFHGSDIHVLHAVNPVTHAPAGETSTLNTVATDNGEEVIDRVREILEETDFDQFTVDQTVGSPSKEIREYAEGNDVDLIVMGTNGRSGIDRVLMGSVTESVVRHSKIPVQTISED